MRLDKYLKVCRLIKRRTVAKEIADNDRILINNRVAKPSSSVVIGDILEIRIGNKIARCKVTALMDNPKKDQYLLMYELLEEINL